MASINATILTALSARAKVAVINTSPGRLKRGLSYHVIKSSRVIRGMITLLHARLSGCKRFYASVDDGIGGIWTGLFAILARMCGMSIVLHHHSYRYIIEWQRVMAWIVAAAGPKACHVTLADEMAQRLRQLYPGVRHTYVAPNPVAKKPLATLPRPRTDLTIGILANLTFEKGIQDFVTIVEQLRHSGIPARGILAGPAPDPAAAAYLTAQIDRNPDVLKHLGPITGSAKESFFADIDIFVFPTQYRTEAYPLVLIEALSRGVPVIAPARGAITSLATLQSARIIGLELDFIEQVVAYLTELTSSPGMLNYLRHIAADEGPKLNEKNQFRQEMLIEVVLGGELMG